MMPPRTPSRSPYFLAPSPGAVSQIRSIHASNKDRSYCRLPIAEDPLQLSSHQRMEEIAKRPERQPVVHHVLDDCRLPCVVEAMGVSPKAIRTECLLVYESDGWLPVQDTGLPAQRHAEQAQPVIDEGTLLHRDRLGREDPKVQFRRGDVLQVDSIREKGEDLFARRQTHESLENMEAHIICCESKRPFALSGSLYPAAIPLIRCRVARASP